MPNYKDMMFRFSREDLKHFLGEDTVDVLVEWIPAGDDLLTKARLIDMINMLYGSQILKNRDFRKAMLMSMSEKEILEIRDNCLTGSQKTITDPKAIVDIIVEKPWGNNKTSRYLVERWGYPNTIFESKKDNTESVVDIVPNKQFFELLDYQFLIKQRVLNNLASGNLQERMLIHMPTGTGKTKTTMHIVSNYYSFHLQNKGAIIWVAHTTELLQQAYETFCDVWSHLGNASMKAYRLWGSRTIESDTPINGIVFCGLAKLMSIKESDSKLFERLKQDCRLLVFDEAHKAAANQTKRIIEELLRMPEGYQNRALIGLSATPGRTTIDSYNNNLLSNMFGNKLISIDADVLNQINLGKLRALNTVAEQNIIKYFQDRRILSKMKLDRLVYQTSFTDAELNCINRIINSLEADSSDYTTEQLKVFARNKERNKAIMERLRQLYVNGIPTIVFACSVNHAKMLSAMLTLEEIPNSLVIGDMPTVERNEAIERFKDRESNTNIIINYEVLTTGFDSKNIKCVFITRPTKSIVLYSQMLGRGLRGPMMGGNDECLLIDIDDNLQAFDNSTAFSHFDSYWMR